MVGCKYQIIPTSFLRWLRLALAGLTEREEENVRNQLEWVETRQQFFLRTFSACSGGGKTVACVIARISMCPVNSVLRAPNTRQPGQGGSRLPIAYDKRKTDDC